MKFRAKIFWYRYTPLFLEFHILKASRQGLRELAQKVRQRQIDSLMIQCIDYYQDLIWFVTIETTTHHQSPSLNNQKIKSAKYATSIPSRLVAPSASTAVKK